MLVSLLLLGSTQSRMVLIGGKSFKPPERREEENRGPYHLAKGCLMLRHIPGVDQEKGQVMSGRVRSEAVCGSNRIIYFFSIVVD